MDGLFVIIAIIIFVANFAAKQQNQNRGRGGMNSRRPLTKQVRNIEPPDRAAGNMENVRYERVKGTAEYSPACDSEGIEIEDRSWTGSLNYTEQSKSSEGMGIRSIKPEQRQRKEKKVVSETEIIREEPVFDLTEEKLLRSIVMAEVLGPPRAIKRNIR